MKAIVALCSAVLALFLDDNSLTVAVLVVVAGAASLSFGFHAPFMLIGGLLALGLPAALVISTLRAVDPIYEEPVS
jgi:hypothetical protein